MIVACVKLAQFGRDEDGWQQEGLKGDELGHDEQDLEIVYAGLLTQQSSCFSLLCVGIAGHTTMPGFLSHWGDDNPDRQLRHRASTPYLDSYFSLLPLWEMTETT